MSLTLPRVPALARPASPSRHPAAPRRAPPHQLRRGRARPIAARPGSHAARRPKATQERGRWVSAGDARPLRSRCAARDRASARPPSGQATRCFLPARRRRHLPGQRSGRRPGCLACGIILVAWLRGVPAPPASHGRRRTRRSCQNQPKFPAPQSGWLPLPGNEVTSCLIFRSPPQQHRPSRPGPAGVPSPRRADTTINPT